MILNEIKRRMALMMGGSIVNTVDNYPTYFQIGTGSGTTLASSTTLVTSIDRQGVTSTDANTPFYVTYQGDWNSLEISGNQISEFGLCGSAAGLTGSMFSRTGFPAITFDSTNELRIEEVWEVF